MTRPLSSYDLSDASRRSNPLSDGSKQQCPATDCTTFHFLFTTGEHSGPDLLSSCTGSEGIVHIKVVQKQVQLRFLSHKHYKALTNLYLIFVLQHERKETQASCKWVDCITKQNVCSTVTCIRQRSDMPPTRWVTDTSQMDATMPLIIQIVSSDKSGTTGFKIQCAL